MEQKDLEIIEQFGNEDPQLKALWDQHIIYEKMLDKLESKSYLSPTETQEIKELKKKKLAGKTQMQTILDKYREKEE
ncbi:DUF465 domain-containing protein [Pseudodesulfovibrio senegalensis]|jgi:hypothetical protein|uniref:DUF465 domain-containing protein n=1 Tax=Pseudodesulfovibrio senegalensis TaxID=1721087 RepID=A0A6N6N105_9BACT|nr:DUF465 domain-containing protein [Pseudodesulfovibrio senegalensis]KAB1441174.1 DUF465 domain-containing protein [Pseudodesulfovibrio senegalensis]